MTTFHKGALSEDDIRRWLLDLRGRAYTAYSHYNVAAVIRARVGFGDDYYFAGVNAENADYRLSTHAEEACIAAMVTGLGRAAEIAEVWVMGAPEGASPEEETAATLASCCGKCRQQIAGLAQPEARVHSLSLGGALATTTVGDFLPDVFSFRNYIPELMQARPESKIVKQDADAVRRRLLRDAPQDDAAIAAWLAEIESIDYISKVNRAAVLQLDNGCYAAGTRVEEAAFVSISAVQAALALAVSAYGNVRVKAVWSAARTRNGDHADARLTLSALQALQEHALDRNIPIYTTEVDGRVTTRSFADAAVI